MTLQDPIYLMETGEKNCEHSSSVIWKKVKIETDVLSPLKYNETQIQNSLDSISRLCSPTNTLP